MNRSPIITRRGWLFVLSLNLYLIRISLHMQHLPLNAAQKFKTKSY